MYKVLVVDDEYVIVQMLKKLIDASELPFQVIGEAEDGAEALKMVEQRKPDLVFTDIRMPVMGGLELVEEAGKQFPRTVFIIVSGHDDFTYAQHALRYGVVDYLLKPLKPALLIETLQRVLERFQADQDVVAGHSEWMLYCSDRAEMLVKHVWLLDEAEAVLSLKNIHRELTEEIKDTRLLQQVYRDLLALIEGEIDRQLGAAKHAETSVLPSLPDAPDAVFDAIELRLMQKMEEIRQSRNWNSHGLMSRASEYIGEHFAEDSLSLQRVAEVSGMSPSYFSRLFKEELGISFIQHVTKLRMEKAMAMLSDPDNKTYEIAYEVGYKDYSHFTKVFKKHWGLSPTEVKKRI